MHTFKHSKKLDKVSYEVRGPVVERANKMEEAGISVLKLNIGNPATFGFSVPSPLVELMAKNLPQCEGYSHSKGTPEARKAIFDYAQSHNIPVKSIDDIYTGNGASELVNTCLMALLDPGDEVLIPAPDYPLWTGTTNLAGGTAVHYICDEQADWNPDLDDIRKKITSNTKAIVIINPNNPTGAVYSREFLEEIVEIARQNNLIIFADEMYDRLIMEGEHVSIASMAPDLFCVTFGGLSKSHMACGFRIGWMILSGDTKAAQDYIDGIVLISSMRLCSNVPGQSIIAAALKDTESPKSYLVPGGRLYEQRRVVVDALKSIDGIDVVAPRATFYCFPRIDTKKFNISDDVAFARDLLEQEHVLIVQGSGFNWPHPDHFRVVFLPPVDELDKGMQSIGRFLAGYKQS